MAHRILITGASGYLGGTMLAHFKHAQLPTFDKLYALVRTDSQAEAVKGYRADPLNLDLKDESAIHKAVFDNSITIVFFLIDAMSASTQTHFIKALGEVKRSTGRDTHFIHVSYQYVAGMTTSRTNTKPDSFLTDKRSKDILQPRRCSHRPSIVRRCNRSA